MLFITVVGTIADVDQTTPGQPSHPAPVLFVETDEGIERVVLPETAWRGPLETLQISRRVRVGGHLEFPPPPGSLPVAMHFEFVDVH